MTLHTYDTNTPGDTIKVEAPKKSAAKKKSGTKEKKIDFNAPNRPAGQVRKAKKRKPAKKKPPVSKITIEEQRKLEEAAIASSNPVDPIEHSIMNPIPQPPREKNSHGDTIDTTHEIVGDILTVRQERFCQLYTDEGSFFGNGVQAYIEVYDIDTTKTGWYKTACAAASRLLSNVKVTTRINSLLEGAWLNKEFMDKQLLFIATQHADMGNKLGAIKEFNRITKRVDDAPSGPTIYIVDEVKLQKIRDMKKRIAK